MLIVLLASLLILTGYLISVYRAAKQLPTVDASQLAEERLASRSPSTKISVIIPVFNEEENIEDCLKSVVTSTQLSVDQLEVWVVDDQSTDRTPAILETLTAHLNDPRVHLLTGLPRPTDRVWTGKSWACQQGAERASGEFLLFMDADVRLYPDAIPSVATVAIAQQLDFLTCIPTIVCKSLIEWLVQPLMFINLMITFNSGVVKNPKTRTTYALGPFLFFRASAYRAIGGHCAVSAYVAEDVAFACKLKWSGFKLKHFLGANLASLRMYTNLPSLWEGWSKNLYVGAQRSLLLMLLLSGVMLMIYTVPWVGFMLATYQLLNTPSTLHGIEVGVAILAIALQYLVRQQGAKPIGSSTQYWWLQGIGGLFITVLAIASVIKAETGWGWTWRGRKLVATK